MRPAVLRWVPVVGSTQDAVHQLAEEGAPEGTALAALEQTAGRGSRGREWSSGAGGLWMSVLLRPVSLAGVETLSLRVGLEVVRVLESLGGRGLMLKWPNDVMAGARKAGGILCEGRWSGDRPAWVVVGVGLNVTNTVPPDLALRATRLADHGIGLGAEALAPVIGEAVLAAGRQAGPLDAAERGALAAHDWLRGRELAEPVAGIADGILADGALRVRTAGGDISLVRAGPIEPAAPVSLAE